MLVREGLGEGRTALKNVGIALACLGGVLKLLGHRLILGLVALLNAGVKHTEEGVAIQHIGVVMRAVTLNLAKVNGQVEEHHGVKILTRDVLKFLFDRVHIGHAVVHSAHRVKGGEHGVVGGQAPIVGPQGPAGRSVSNISLNTNYQLVFSFSDGSQLILAQSIRGPQGPAGKDGAPGRDGAPGPEGPAGKGINIIGTYTNISLAPTASTQQMGDAFLLTDGATTTLYVLTGTPDNPATYAWQETTFGGGTMVYVGGQAQTTLNADNYLTKLIPPYGIGTGDRFYVYTVGSDGSTKQMPAAFSYASFPDTYRLVVRNPDGNIVVKTDAIDKGSGATVINKDYLTNKLTPLENRVSNLENSGGGSSGGSTSGSGWNIYSTDVGGGDQIPLLLDIGETYLMMVQAEGQVPGAGYYHYYTNPFLISYSIIDGTEIKIPLLGNEEAMAALRDEDRHFIIDDMDNGYYLPTESSEEAGEDTFSWNVSIYYKNIDVDPYY